MKTKLSSALGLALLAASLTFTSSFACSNSGDDQTSIVNAPAAEVAQPSVAEVTPPSVAEVTPPSVAEVTEPSLAQFDPPLSVVSESEPPATESPPPAIYSVDAIRVEVTQSVTIAAPGQSIEDDQPTHTGSIAEDTAPPSTVQSDEAIVAAVAQSATVIVPGESAEDEQPSYTASTATDVTGSTGGEAPATERAANPGADKRALDNNDP